MASSFQHLLAERKYPFLFVLFVLFLCISLLLFTNRDRLPFISVSDLERSQEILSSFSSKNESKSASVLVPDTANKREAGDDKMVTPTDQIEWKLCNFSRAVDYIPCLDNSRAIKELKSRRHMEHRERHCPYPSRRCLVPLPLGYRTPVPWPKSRDMIWINNVPHPMLVEYKKDQHWVQKSGEYFVFPGGGTQFKHGAWSYIQFIEKILPSIEWGKHTRVVLDVGCGVASFGGYLLDKGVLTMSFAPKDEHDAQIEFALERGIPAVLSVIGIHKLNFPDNVYDAVHCARCRVHWDADGGLPLLELNRILRPGGYFIWSATPVYRDNSRDQSVWNAMLKLTGSICWKMVVKAVDSNGVGVVIYQKPVSNSCYGERKKQEPPLCDENSVHQTSWYALLENCLPQIPEVYSDSENNWPKFWPERLNSKPSSLSVEPNVRSTEKRFYEDTRNWSTLVINTYFQSLSINWSSIRNVIDMNAVYGGFAAALIKKPLWVMNTVSTDGPDTLPVIFDRGLIGIYHDWCESFSTYPRTYDLLHSSFLFGNLSLRCDIVDVAVEMDRILRPGGWILIQDTIPMIERLLPIMRSLQWDITLHSNRFLVGRKGFWRPAIVEPAS